MIPFALFTRTVLDSGIVRVEFKLSQWTQRGTDWVYHIPNSVHMSGDVPKVHIVDKQNHTLTGVGVEYNYAGMITLVVQTPIQNFTGYFMGEGFIIPDNQPIRYFSIGDRSETFYDSRTRELYFMSTVDTAPRIVKDATDIKFASVYRNMIHYIDANDQLWIYGSNQEGQKGTGDIYGDVRITHCYDGVKESYGCAMQGNSSLENQFSVLLTLTGDVYVTGKASAYSCLGVGVTDKISWYKLDIPEKIKKIHVSNTTFCIGESGKIYMFGFNAHGQIPDPKTLTGNVYETSLPLNAPVFVSSVGTFYIDTTNNIVYAAGWQPNIGRPEGAGWQPTNLPADVIKISGNFMYSGGMGNNFALTSSGEVWMTGIMLPPDAHTTTNTWEKLISSGAKDIFGYANSYNDPNVFALLVLNSDGTHTQYNLGTAQIPDLYQLPI